MPDSAVRLQPGLFSGLAWPSGAQPVFVAGLALSDLDVALGRMLAQQSPDSPALAVHLAMACSAALAQGHPCLDLQSLGRDGALPASLADCHAALQQAGFVGDGSGAHPLVLHGQLLYLARYWFAACRIRESIRARLQTAMPEKTQLDAMRMWLDTLFPQQSEGKPPPEADWQKIACATALMHGFSIITGGPGTGKTHTVVRLLVALQALARERGLEQGLRISLAAPTGKAAARLTASVSKSLHALAGQGGTRLEAVLALVPIQAGTLHSLLGSRPDSRRFAYHRDRPLDLDVLLVDEASMMDIEIMDATLAALPAGARLVLLGDKDQLLSVEAGAVFAELSARAFRGHYTPVHAAMVHAATGQALPDHTLDPGGGALDQAVVMLRKSRRFDAGSGIGQFAVAVNQNRPALVGQLLRQGLPDLHLVVPAEHHHRGGQAWMHAAGILGRHGYPALFRHMHATRPQTGACPEDWDAWALEMLRHQSGFQVLCALREGPWGVQGLNQGIESSLMAAGLLPSGSPWYPGRPVMVLRNQPSMGLANGDIGLALMVPDPDGLDAPVLRVAFMLEGQDTVRWVSPARLPAIETVYAMTIHKSQGSEFSHVVLVLPDSRSPLLCRELLYTGASRASASLTLVLPGGDDLLEHAVTNRTYRTAGVWNA